MAVGGSGGLAQIGGEALHACRTLAGEGVGFGGGEIAGGRAIGVEEIPATGVAAAREDREEGGAVPITGKEQDLDEDGGREGCAERGQHTETGEAVAAMDMGAEGAGPVPHEEDAAMVWGVVHGDPLGVHIARAGRRPSDA